MDKIEKNTFDLNQASRLVSDAELDVIAGAFMIYGAELCGCSNNLREPALPMAQFGSL